MYTITESEIEPSAVLKGIVTPLHCTLMLEVMSEASGGSDMALS